MTKYKNALPQLNGGLFLTDGGLETTLIFEHGFDIPQFASFPLLDDDRGRRVLRAYFDKYAAIAVDAGHGFILEAPTWRASKDWGAKLGYSPEDLDRVNREAIAFVEEVRATFENETSKIVVSGCVGPQSDAYRPDAFMTCDEAQTYHSSQIETLSSAGADMINVATITYVEEAIGITRAAQAAGILVAMSFTVETDGRLPSGQLLKDAIEEVDAATNDGPVYFGINCAHPTHYEDTIANGEDWVRRIHALRSNASKLSHAELDEAEELDAGNPVKWGDEHRQLRDALSHINIIGGCCGTDHRHVEETSKACAA